MLYYVLCIINSTMNSDLNEEKFTSKYIFGVPVMEINTDGLIVINSQSTCANVKNLNIESAGALMLPFSSKQGMATESARYEEIVFEDFDHFISADTTKYSSFVSNDCEQKKLNDFELTNKTISVKSEKDLQNEMVYKCRVCFKEFINKVQLNVHKSEHSDASYWKCVICEKTFSQQSNLWKHISLHTGEKPFICDVCNKGFTQLANLQKHKLVHTGEKPFQCPVCNKEFSQQANMLKHHLLHTGEKPFICKTCNKSFTQKSNLAKHELLHTGEKPHTCNICSKSFTQQSNLKKHEYRHINHRPYHCNICDKSYIQKVSLQRHKCSGSSVSSYSSKSDITAIQITIGNSNNNLPVVKIKSEK